ncbi:hypothetical protein PoB_005844600 [Plakobranchus ocellatus]|uniref:Uncharacterized protein n=1 Tax=Plakobranchus ocellatus TaxID=259542 RepID=A0AAV4CGJ6_9GAST|nr:hypothetical protein PoB_005844600 [Plakobranchus ocellatus]
MGIPVGFCPTLTHSRHHQCPPNMNKQDWLDWFLYIASPQQSDLRLSGPTSGEGANSRARTRDRRVPEDLRVDMLATTPRMSVEDRKRKDDQNKSTKIPVSSPSVEVDCFLSFFFCCSPTLRVLGSSCIDCLG